MRSGPELSQFLRNFLLNLTMTHYAFISDFRRLKNRPQNIRMLYEPAKHKHKSIYKIYLTWLCKWLTTAKYNNKKQRSIGLLFAKA